MRQRATTLTLICCCATTASALEWKTPDGKLAVTVPDRPRFAEVDPPPPPLSAVWVTADETIRLGVVEQHSPPNTRLVRAAFEKALAQEINGKIVASSADVRRGHEVLTVTAHGSLQGDEVYITTSAFITGDRAYKLMAIGMGKDPRADADAMKFIGSLRILVPNEKQVAEKSDIANPKQAADSGTSSSNQTEADRITGQIGAVGVLLLVVAIAILLARRWVKCPSA